MPLAMNDAVAGASRRILSRPPLMMIIVMPMAPIAVRHIIAAVIRRMRARIFRP